MASDETGEGGAKRHDLVVIGAGPGGYVAAIRAAQLGLDAACVEMVPQLGGTCLRIGCIPSKALLESSELYEETRKTLGRHGVKVGSVELDLATLLGRKDQVVGILTKGIEALFKKNGVTRYTGRGRLDGPGVVLVEGDGGSVRLEAEHVIVATGSRPIEIPSLPFGGRIGSSTEALSYDPVPEHLVVVGGGYIGLELGSVWRRLGAKVTVLEALDRILPGLDGEIAAEAKKLLERQGLDFRLSSRVTGAEQDDEGVRISLEGAEPIACDRVLVAVGRRPLSDGVGLETAGVEVDERGRIPVDERFGTSVKGIYAIGDVIPGPMLAHVAEDEAMACVEGIVNGYCHVNYDVIPAVVYTHPEIASVGRTEDELAAAGVAFRKGSFPFRANGRARTLAQVDGFVKVLADERTDRVLGVHILGPRAGDLIAEAAAAMEFGASSEDLARTCHAHPTLPEALRQAALGVRGPTVQM